MRQILDLHIHSRYARACSRDLTLANIDKACRIKGVDIIATGDFSYPTWFESIKNELEPCKTSDGKQSGLYKLKIAKDDKIKFILSNELALIYKQGDKCRRIHLVIHAPNIEALEELNKYFDKHFNIRSDGRPIMGMTTPELFKLCFSIHPKFLIYPAHIWTPWFSVFGSKSGFDKFEECFGEYTKSVFAYETGLSSDPEMNWRISELDNLSLLSNSDAHSLPNIGREANIFDLDEISFNEIYEAVKNKDLKKILKTIEFYPEEGMYHFDGHRDCKISFEPAETNRNKGICPVCKKNLTIGVLNRVEELADRPLGERPKNSYDYIKLVELDKIIAEGLNIVSRKSKKVQVIYDNMIKTLGNELDILMSVGLDDIKEAAGQKIAEGIKRVREGNLDIKPGFDGQYGEVRIFKDSEKFVQNKLL